MAGGKNNGGGVNGGVAGEDWGEHMAKIPKTAAGYVHFDGTHYWCRECWKFYDWRGRCTEVEGKINPQGGCNTFVPGKGPTVDLHVDQKLTQLEAGYQNNPHGFSCGQCEYFSRENWDCRKVDKDSPGTDAGMIHPKGCCNLFEKDPVFGVL